MGLISNFFPRPQRKRQASRDSPWTPPKKLAVEHAERDSISAIERRKLRLLRDAWLPWWRLRPVFMASKPRGGGKRKAALASKVRSTERRPSEPPRAAAGGSSILNQASCSI